MGSNLQAFAETCKERGHHHRGEKEILSCLLAEYASLSEPKQEPAAAEAG